MQTKSGIKIEKIYLKLQNILDKSVDNKTIFGSVIKIESGDNSFSWLGSAGNLGNDKQYFIASTTKLYITAVILKLRAEGALNTEDKISKYLSKDVISGIHIFKNIDYSNDITIKQLMAHTSGIPDYFQQKRASGKSLEMDIMAENDQHWTFEKVAEETKKMKPKFKPGQKSKALYSDTNYQLLGKIIEIITGKGISGVLTEYVFNPLHLTKTYVYENVNDTAPIDFYFRKKPLHIPLAMSSFGPDGGVVSTASESIVFLRAFFDGHFFPREYLEEITKEWNRINFPLEYGIGIMRFKLPWFFAPFKPALELIGHSGLSGAFEYYCPKKDLFIAGTVNQVANPSLSYKLIVKLLNSYNPINK